VNLILPPFFVCTDRLYAYSVAPFITWDRQRFTFDRLFLAHGVCLSGDYVFHASNDRACVYLQRDDGDDTAAWIALTSDEARIVSGLKAEHSFSNVT
jgi:hypothetical protein